MTRNTRKRAQQLAATQTAVTKRDELKSTEEVEGVVVGLAAAGVPEQFDGESNGVEVSPTYSEADVAANSKNPPDLKANSAVEPSFSSNKKVRENMRLAKPVEKTAISDESQPNLKAMGTDLSHKEATDGGSLPVVPYIENGGDAGPVSLPEKLHGSDLAPVLQPDNMASSKQDGFQVQSNVVAAGSGSLQQPIKQVTSQPLATSALHQVNNAEKGNVIADKGHVPTAPSKSPWLEAVKNNRKVEFMGKLKENLEGVDLDGLGVTLFDSDVYPEEDEEAKCLIGMFNGRFPGRDMVQKMVDYWPKPCKFHYHNSGWIVFKFEEVCHLEEVLNSASFYAANQIMVVKKMPREFDFSKDEYSLVPVWVQFPNLPLCAWKEESLNKICTFIGTPLNVDMLTKDRETISFARCLIECDLTVPLPTQMMLTMPSGKKRVQKILYEEKPKFCNKCKRIGHVEGDCHAISIPGETIYISRSRLEATRNRNKTSRGRSKKRFQSRGPSSVPATTYAPKASASVPLEKNADSIVNSINTDDVTLAKTTASKDVPVSNAFDVIGSWATDSELEEGNQGNIGEKVAAKDIPVPASKVNGKKDNVNQKGNETQKGNVSKPGPAARMKGNGRGNPSSFKTK